MTTKQLRSLDDEWDAFGPVGKHHGTCIACGKEIYSTKDWYPYVDADTFQPLHEECEKHWLGKVIPF